MDEAPWASPFQRGAWAQHQESRGTVCHRFIAATAKGALGMQVLGRSRFGMQVLRMPGGPVCLTKALPEVTEVALAGLAQWLPRWAYLRTNWVMPQSANHDVAMLAAGWRRAAVRRGSELSLVVPLDDQMDSRTSKSWRRNVRKARKQDVEVRIGADHELVGDLHRLYQTTLRSKGVTPTYDRVLLDTLCSSPTSVSAFQVAVAYLEGEPMAARLFYRHRRGACDLIAGTADHARQNSTGISYLLVQEVLEFLQARGCSYFDFMGIDPLHAAPVYEFKKRTGGMPVRYQGEWEVCHSGLLAGLVSAGLRLRGGGG